MNLRKPHRKEVHTRTRFANERALYWHDKIKNAAKSGNILTCKATMKFLQARKIYVHYSNEFQLNAKLPIMK